MNRISTKIIILVISLLLFFTCSTSVAALENVILECTPQAEAPIEYGFFQYWYSNSWAIGHLAKTNNTVGVEVEYGTMSYTDATSYTDYALSVWQMANFNLTRVPRSSYNSANLKIKVISRATANFLGIEANVGAFNQKTIALVGFAQHWDGSFRDIDVYEISSYQTYIIWDENYSPNQWKSVFAHEHGHGIGYMGHDFNKGSLMYPVLQNPPKIAPNTRDKVHMSNVYIFN